MQPEISVVVPVKDERENVVPLLREIAGALSSEAAEIIFVDDASTDGTAEALLAARSEFPTLRLLRHEKNAGQSASLSSGVLAAKGKLIVTLDGDGQNDPADIPALLKLYRDPARAENVRMVAGERAKRQDSWAKRMASKLANEIRGRMLRDKTKDTGCGLKLIERDAFLALPYFDHMHRFLPALMKREGFGISFVRVNHRPRKTGKSKYNNWGRFKVSIADMRGVMWLMRRRRSPGRVREL